MSKTMTARQFLAAARALDREILDKPIDLVVDLVDGPRCDDCSREHRNAWDAIFCDEKVDAKQRARARRRLVTQVRDISRTERLAIYREQEAMP